MAGLAVDNFVLSFAAAFGQLAGQAIDAARPRSMWYPQADEANSTAVYTVIRPYGMPPDPVGQILRQPTVSIQLDTRGKTSAAAVLGEAYRLSELLRDPDSDEGAPRCHWAIAGKRMASGAIADDADGSWLVNSVLFTSGPGLVSVDSDAGRFIATSNFDLVFYRVAAAA